MGKKLAAVAAVILAVVLMALFVWQDRDLQQKNEQYVVMSSEIDSLQVKKKQLENEMTDALESPKKYGVGITSLLFTGIQENLYTDIYPLMKEYGYTGTMLLSENQLPGLEGCISVEQFQELILAGWSYCQTFDPEEVVQITNRTWKEKWEERYQQYGVPMSDAVYFPDSYEIAWDESAAEVGISTILNHGEIDNGAANTESSIWHLRVRAWRNQNAKNNVKQAMKNKEVLVFTVEPQVEEKAFSIDSFQNMLEFFKGCVEEESLAVLPLNLAKEQFYAEQEVRARLTEEAQAKEQELRQQIADVDEQINRVME